MDILINPVTSLVQRLVDGLIQESYFCHCFNPIVEDFEKEKGNLIAIQKTVQKDVETAKNACQEIEEKVKKWQLDASNLIEEDTKTKQKCLFNLCPNCTWQYWRGKDLVQKKVDITKLIENSNFTKVGRAIQGPRMKFYSSQDYIDFESRKSAKKQLIDALADRSNYLIGLQGMGGCGKSELVKQVGNEVQNLEPKLFERVIYVVVSSSPDVSKIQHDIARHLGLTLEEGKISEHPEKLWSRLTNGEKILIVIDDIWEDLNLKDKGIPLGEDHNGCCVLITTCNNGKRVAQGDDDLSNDFKNVGQMIVEECQSLAIVIVVVASTLREKLRLLGLINCKLKKNPWKVISKLSKIEELYFMGNGPDDGSDWGILTGFFAELFDINSVVQPLQRYRIDIRDSSASDVRTRLLSEDDSTSRVLIVDHFPGFDSHATIIDLVRRAEILQLRNIQGGYKSVTPDVVEAIGDMNELIHLDLDSCSEIKYLIDTATTISFHGATIFNKLVKLDLANMNQLMELCHDTPSNLFRELQDLRISCCDKLDDTLFAGNLILIRLEELYIFSCSILKSMFSLLTAKSLVHLKRLEIFSCNQLKRIITNKPEEEEEEIADDHRQQIHHSFFPKLNRLDINGCNQLEYIFPFSSVPTLLSLENICIRSCFPTEVHVWAISQYRSTFASERSEGNLASYV
ncbi:hypothetical protein L6164_023955 [Bauhinia variegata]|uniref:Uncharacterized protein n=1 Tax=Bauhinia variegata TaxID=167791 RepID=A0ACB9LW37_BAUVA|nr:hypothetical protein L6164_023955 [Bauhinia variegata]